MRRIGIVLACVIGSASPAAAATAPASTQGKLASPPITEMGGAHIECSIVNISGAAAQVTIRVIENDAQIHSKGPMRLNGGFSLNDDAFCSGSCSNPRCVFTTSTPASGFRASACVAEESNTNPGKICLPAQ